MLVFVLCALLAGAQPEPPEAMSLARKAYELARSGQMEQAVSALERAITLAPRNPLYRSALGGIYEREHKLPQAADAFAEAVRLDPANTSFRLRLAQLQARNGNNEAAYSNVLRVLELDAANASAKELLEAVSLDWGAELARADRNRRGLALARDSARRYPQSARVQLMLGLFETRNQQNLNAVAAYSRAVELDPQSAEANVGLGIAQSNAGLLREAQATFEAGIRRFPGDPAHRQAYGVLLIKLAEAGAAPEARAIEMFHSALKLDPNLAEAHYQLGKLALNHDDARTAASHFEAAAKNGLDDSRLHYAAARALRRLGNTAEAEKHVRLFQLRKEAEQAVLSRP